ncbi:MAG: SpoIIE family protein phosphatase [Nitrospinae bacterium]|nr:SpoIIE family protein phosphatase [Nitrospinota bacterium]
MLKKDYNTKLHEYEGKIKKLSQCLEVAALLNSELNYSNLLKNIMHVAQIATNANGCSLLLYDENQENLYFQVAESKKAGKLLRGRKVELGVGISGTVAVTGESMLIEDAYNHPLFSAKYDKKTGYKTKTILAVPLKYKGGIIGVTMVINKKDGSVFTAEDKFVLEAISNSASIAIENARLHENALQQQKVSQDLEFAKSVQQSFMPQKELIVDKMSFKGINMPAMTISGDFYDYIQINSNETAFIFGDVSGKGVSAALYGARLISNFKMLTLNNKEPEDFCKQLNRLVREYSQNGMFTTLIYGLVNTKKKEVSFVNAGHLTPVLFRSVLQDYKLLDAEQSIPIGIMEDVDFKAVKVSLNKGDSIIFYTDGIIESKNNNNRELGMNNWLKIILKIPKKIKAIPFILKSLQSYSIQKDDMTLLTISNNVSDGVTVRMQKKEFKSSTENLKTIREFINKFLKIRRVDEALIHKIVLCVDEACSNIIKYAYSGKNDEKLLLKQYVCDNEYVVSISDNGAQPDLSKIKPRNLEDIKPGGLGTHFISEIMDSVTYNRSQKGENNLTMKKYWR